MEDTLREWSVCKVGGYEEKKADGRSEGMAQKWTLVEMNPLSRVILLWRLKRIQLAGSTPV